MMIFLKILSFGLLILFFEILISDLIIINNIRPDLLLIYILYTSLKYGRLKGLLSGFILGILEDLITGSIYFGISALCKTISGFLFGQLSNQFNKINPIFYFSYIGFIIALNFFLYLFVLNQNLFNLNKMLFFNIYFYANIYTLIFLFVFNYIKPIKFIAIDRKK